jgi:hypothetical protein
MTPARLVAIAALLVAACGGQTPPPPTPPSYGNYSVAAPAPGPAAPGPAAPSAPTTPEAQREQDNAAAAAEENRQKAALATCIDDESPKARLSCEESCGAKIQVTQCVFGQRNCLAKARDGSDQAICTNGYRQCLVEAGVEVDPFEGCITKCQREKAETTCRAQR